MFAVKTRTRPRLLVVNIACVLAIYGLYKWGETAGLLSNLRSAAEVEVYTVVSVHIKCLLSSIAGSTANGANMHHSRGGRTPASCLMTSSEFQCLTTSRPAAGGSTMWKSG
jgi:hypothetical protein